MDKLKTNDLLPTIRIGLKIKEKERIWNIRIGGKQIILDERKKDYLN